MSRKVMVGMALAVALVTPLAGCTSKGKLTVSKMCAAAGGKYSMQTQTCDAPPVNAKKATDMCQAMGGVYDSGAQVCEVGRD
jgi:hypothetical protein